MPVNPGETDRPTAMQWLRVAAALEQQVHCWSLVAMAEYQRASSSSCMKLGQAEPNATDHQMMGVYCYARTTSVYCYARTTSVYCYARTTRARPPIYSTSNDNARRAVSAS
eukprot:COSAG06_NODE_204_length_20326_cov_8.096060_6_plen_111_part_00